MLPSLPARLFVHVATTIAAIVLISSPSKGQTFDTALEVGDWWIYRVNGVQDVVLMVIGTESIAGLTGCNGFEGDLRKASMKLTRYSRLDCVGMPSKRMG